MKYIYTGSIDKRHYGFEMPLIKVMRHLKDTFFLMRESSIKHTSKLNEYVNELSMVGLTKYQLYRYESMHLDYYVKPYEHVKVAIKGCAYGLGNILLVATNIQIICLKDDYPLKLVTKIQYKTIDSISVNRVERLSVITIATASKMYQIHYINPRLAVEFIKFVISHVRGTDLKYNSRPTRISAI